MMFVLRILAGVVLFASLCALSAMPVQASENSTEQESSTTTGGRFILRTHTGELVTDQHFRGQHMLIYFGYTFCPDVCPVGLQTIAETMDRLGEDAKHFQPLFITLDPERDSPEILRDYVGAFHPRLIGLTGTRIMIDRVAKSYRVRHMRSGESKPGDDNYLIDHTSAIFLMGPEGEYLGRFSHNADPQVVAEKLRKAVQQ